MIPPEQDGAATVLTPADLQAYIAARGITARLVHGLGDTSTVPLAAAALGVQARHVIKSLLFLVKLPSEGASPAKAGWSTGETASPQPVLVISSGERRVDHRAIAAHFGVSRKKVELAPPEVVLTLLGYPAGGVPPLGHRMQVPVLMDADLLALPPVGNARVYGGGGDDSTMLEITVVELRRVLQPEILPLSQGSTAEPGGYSG